VSNTDQNGTTCDGYLNIGNLSFLLNRIIPFMNQTYILIITIYCNKVILCTNTYKCINTIQGDCVDLEMNITIQGMKHTGNYCMHVKVHYVNVCVRVLFHVSMSTSPPPSKLVLSTHLSNIN